MQGSKPRGRSVVRTTANDPPGESGWSSPVRRRLSCRLARLPHGEEAGCRPRRGRQQRPGESATTALAPMNPAVIRFGGADLVPTPEVAGPRWRRIHDVRSGDGVYMDTVRFAVRALTLLMITAAGVMFPTVIAWACTCTAQSDKEHYDAASVVFTGRAVDQREDGRFFAFAFDVDDVTKGDVSDGVEVRATTVDVEGCGLTFDAKSRYQVFAYLDNGVLMTGLCTGSHVVSDQQPVVPGPGKHPSVSPTASPKPLPVETSRPPASIPPSSAPSPATPTSEQTLEPTSSPSGSAAAPTAGDSDDSKGNGRPEWLAWLAAVLAVCLAGWGVLVARRRRP